MKEFKIKKLKWMIQNVESAGTKALLDIEEFEMNQQGKIREYDKQLSTHREELNSLENKKEGK